MTKILIEDISHNHDAWIAQKATGSIGSGDISDILGIGYNTPLKSWAIKTGREPRDPESLMLRWGQVMEPVIGEWAGHVLGRLVTRPDTLYGHDDLEWAVATPDYFIWPRESSVLDADVFEPELLECKSVHYGASHQWREGVPIKFHAQVIWQMGIVGLSKATLAPLIGGDGPGFQPYFIEFDARIFADMVEAAERFRWHVINDVPPPPEAEDKKLIESLIGKLEDRSVILPTEFSETISEYRSVSQEIAVLNKSLKSLEERKTKAQNVLRLGMGNAESATCEGFMLTAKEVHVKEHMRSASSYHKFSIKEVRRA